MGQLKRAGAVWYAVTGLPPFWCLLISVIIAWLFLALGGYTGTQWFIAVKGAFLGFVGGLLGVWAMIYAGGFSNISAPSWRKSPACMALMDPSLPKVGSDPAFLEHGGHHGHARHLRHHGRGISPQCQPVPRHEEIDPEGFHHPVLSWSG